MTFAGLVIFVEVPTPLDKAIASRVVIVLLAAVVTLVAGSVQHARQRRDVRVRQLRGETPRIDTRAVLAGGEGSPRRNAQRGVAIVRVERDALGSKGIHMRRLHNLVAVAAGDGV